MAHTIEFDFRSSAEMPRHRSGLDPMKLDALRSHAPSSHLLRIDNDGFVAARCSLWTQYTPLVEGRAAGVVGHYAARDSEHGVALLHDAAVRLREQGCITAVGPMDGNTWRRYRLVTWHGDEAPFFLEPDNTDELPEHFLSAGFAPLAGYTSALAPDLSQADPRVPDALRRLTTEGVTIRNIDLDRFDAELCAIHRMSLVSFANNVLYTPIGEDEFVEQYRPVLPYVRRELVLIAERERDVVGFVFAVPDLNQRKRGVAMDTVVIKTLAVHPGRRQAGLGTVLMDLCREAAHGLGFRRAIHALMHESNVSQKVSAKTAHTIRRYTLYARSLAP